MVRIQELREQKASIAKEMNNLHEKNANTWNADCQKQWDELDQKLVGVEQQIKNSQRMLDLEAESKFGLSEQNAPVGVENKSASRDVFAKWLRRGENALSQAEWEAVRNVTSTTTGSEGGFTVQSDVAATLLDALKSYTGMRQVAEIIRTTGGNPLSFPTSNGTAEVGELVAENGTAADLDPTFGTLPLNVFKFSSKTVTVPIELLQDSQIDIEAFVMERLATRLGRITEQLFTTGSGSGQPNGLVTAATTGVTAATGGATSVTYDNLVDLQHSVDPDYRRGARVGFMFNDSTLRSIRKIKDGSQRPIFVPGYDVGTPGGMPDTLLGFPIYVNQNFASMAANAKSIAFGDFSYYKIREAMDVQMFRFTDSAYTRKGQVGFLAWMRAGGNLIDVGGAVKLFVNSAT
ncbi:MAG TPA: phage major capsid protein [Planctomycetaceae bacterium]|nr:phage major capsid protein [Planctomycetaceae bacterium]